MQHWLVASSNQHCVDLINTMGQVQKLTLYTLCIILKCTVLHLFQSMMTENITMQHFSHLCWCNTSPHAYSVYIVSGFCCTASKMSPLSNGCPCSAFMLGMEPVSLKILCTFWNVFPCELYNLESSVCIPLMHLYHFHHRNHIQNASWHIPHL